MNILKKCCFKSLSSRADQEIKESLYKNKYFLSSRFSFIEKSVIRWSTEFKKYALLSLTLASLIVANLILWEPLTKSSFISYFQDWKELLGWQDTFLSGQLTVVGVVYPLIVGLVSILFQNKSAKKVIFPVYQKYSGFMFAGLSGLMLSLFIVIGYFLRPIVGEKIFLTICVTTALWLAANLTLTA